MRGTVALAVAGSLGACTLYTPGTLSGSDAGGVAKGRCLEVAIDGEDDPEVDGAVLAVAVGNSCRRAIRIDFSAIELVGYGDGGEPVALHFYDPEHAIKAGVLEARGYAHERFELIGEGQRITTVCADLSAFGPDSGLGRVCSALPTPVTWAHQLEEAG